MGQQDRYAKAAMLRVASSAPNVDGDIYAGILYLSKRR